MLVLGELERVTLFAEDLGEYVGRGTSPFDYRGSTFQVGHGERPKGDVAGLWTYSVHKVLRRRRPLFSKRGGDASRFCLALATRPESI